MAWLTDEKVLQAGLQWAKLSREAAATGLQPVLISGLFGQTARLLEVGFAEIRLMVTRPPTNPRPALMDNPFWDFWWD